MEGRKMKQRTNNELRDSRLKNNREDYSEETFKLIYNILLEQGETIPSQIKQEEITKEESNTMTLAGFFSFQFMISSKLIQSFYIIGAITGVYCLLDFIYEEPISSGNLKYYCWKLILASSL